ncbi:hypothetical protein DPM19_33220 [Actinomadura craniellae]|uniref:SWIM-type domain-containing protein n=1 Tax=Actinomadura craniellae TaxID=2231787 RepID=A0A365GVK2_9ACTN|nr:SWIM zinc finger family protein [Actinomadura craniellae]RAY10829.1 hypothetical protein DPM19_33220 [Actinomadura craniellae]
MTEGEEEARGFPAFPPVRGGRGPFARSWWGRAWLRALEDTSLAAEPLARGRRYASTGRVGPITISPGRIAAPVRGADEDLHRTVVFVERLSDAEWERLLTEVAGRAGHIAALLDRDMPRELVAAAGEADVRLLPGLGDLEPECDCPGWEHPCEHAAALCYQAAWLLDRDPFVLLLMRGRGERELVGELRRRNAPDPAGPAVPGVAAAAAYARPVPAPPDPLPPPGPRGPLRVPAGPGVDPAALDALAASAAVRARALLAGGRPAGLDGLLGG